MSHLHNNIHHLSSILSQQGIEQAVISPGSRNAPLTIALARNPYIQCFSIVDERSAAFIALGMAKANKKPIILCCTSGTALLNYYPAITEAYYTGVPLLVLSADRPPELIDNWDGQCIRQDMVFDNHILSSYTLPSYTNKEDCKGELEEIIKIATEEAILKKGPVHINVPLKEPLYNEIPTNFFFTNGKFIKPDLQVEKTNIKSELFEKIILINGANYACNNTLNLYLKELKKENKIVIVNDIISNKTEENSPNFDSFLLERHSNNLKPDLLITTGKFNLSKSLKAFLRKNQPLKQYHLSEEDCLVGDPFDTYPENLIGDIVENLKALLPNECGSTEFTQQWIDASLSHKKKMEVFFNGEKYGEFKACHTIGLSLKKEQVLHLANSTSIRYYSYLKDFLSVEEIHGNRGTSGIDGCTSTAVGFALAQPNKEHILITGDIAFFYDINALWVKQLPQNLKIILLNNKGGGIFRYINGPNKLPELEEFFETTHERTAENTAKEFGIDYTTASNQEELEKQLITFHKSKNMLLLEVFTDKFKNEIQFNKFKEL